MSLTVVNGVLQYNGQPCNEVGLNVAYLLARRWYNSTDTQHIETLDKLAENNIRIIRCVAIPNAGGTGGGLGTWGTATGLSAAFYTAHDAIYDYAATKGIKIIPTLFATYWGPANYKLEKLNQLGVQASATRAYMRTCTIEYVTHYLNHPAIAAWEITNEWNNYAELNAYPAGNDYTAAPYSADPNNLITIQNFVDAIQDIAVQIRSVDSSRAILSGNAGPWFTTRLAADGYEGILNLINPNPINTISVHLYSYPTNGVWFRGGYEPLSDIIQIAKKVGRNVQKPVILGECGVSESLQNTNKDYNLLAQHVTSSDAAPLTLVWNFYKPGSTLPDSNTTYDFWTDGVRTRYLNLVKNANTQKITKNRLRPQNKIPNKYMVFNGAQAAYFPMPNLDGNFSLSFWAKTVGPLNTNFPRIISATSDDSTNGFSVIALGTAGNQFNEPYFRCFTSTGGQSATSRTGLIENNRWKHFAYVSSFWETTCVANTAANTLELSVPNLKIKTGDLVRFTTTGTLPSPLVVGQDYYIVKQSDNTIQIATGQGNSYLPLVITLTTSGTGVHTIKSSHIAVYQNGLKSTADNLNIFTGNWINPTGNFVIGANYTAAAAFFRGHIGNVRLWQYGLSELDVWNEYYGYTPNNAQDILVDNTNNLTLIGNPEFINQYQRSLRT
jgi:hypothetical protein